MQKTKQIARMLNIYRASAGAGKTHHLTGEFLKFLFRKDYLPEIMNISDADQMRNWFIDKMKNAGNSIKSGGTDHLHHMVKKALEYINSNFHKEISLDEISQMLNLS